MNRLNWLKKAFSFFLLWTAAALATPAQTFTTLHSFDGADGSGPSVLVQGTDGNFYGSSGGGTNGDGTAFRITPAGALTTLYIFGDHLNGAYPSALILGSDGTFYGTTSNTFGTVFQLTPAGTLTTFFVFGDIGQGDGPDGLAQGSDGNFYGATEFGGNTRVCGEYGCGTVYKLTPGGALTSLHKFDIADGEYPLAPPIQGTDGNFYGTTNFGGAGSLGTVYKITTRGMFTILYNFCSLSGCTDGYHSYSSLIQATDGNFYGSAFGGGSGNGVIFKVTPSGTESVLYSFTGPDGQGPYGSLTQANDGNLYGTTLDGGANGDGTIFKLTLGGTLTTLHSFDGTDGSFPYVGLVQGTNGIFYGGTSAGGSSGNGTIFSLSVGLRPFVKTNPVTGAVGAPVNILGTNLTGATSVTFNGIPAVFTVTSHSLITTTVPAGATSGKVQVTTPGGTLSSNMPFRVLP